MSTKADQGGPGGPGGPWPPLVDQECFLDCADGVQVGNDEWPHMFAYPAHQPGCSCDYILK